MLDIETTGMQSPKRGHEKRPVLRFGMKRVGQALTRIGPIDQENSLGACRRLPTAHGAENFFVRGGLCDFEGPEAYLDPGGTLKQP